MARRQPARHEGQHVAHAVVAQPGQHVAVALAEHLHRRAAHRQRHTPRPPPSAQQQAPHGVELQHERKVPVRPRVHHRARHRVQRSHHEQLCPKIAEGVQHVMPPNEPHRPVEQQSHSHHAQHLEVMKAHKGHKGRPRLHGLILQRQAVGTQKGKHGHAVVSQVGNPLPPRVHASRASHLPPRHRLLRLVGIFIFDSRPRQPVHKVMAHNGHYSQASQRLTHGQCEHRLLWPSVRGIHRFHFSSIYNKEASFVVLRRTRGQR